MDKVILSTGASNGIAEDEAAGTSGKTADTAGVVAFIAGSNGRGVNDPIIRANGAMC
jgi:hypothetical protein